MPPNVLLVVFDTARADGFEPYGSPQGTTPTVAQLAARGGAFDLAVAPCNWTMPSHASLFTGLLPSAAGLRNPPENDATRVRGVLEGLRPRLLPDVLRRAGYATAGVSCNPWISRANGFDGGFERFVDVKATRRVFAQPQGPWSRVLSYLEAITARVDDGAAECGRVIERWIADDGRRPFFWFVNLMECHSPYLPPRPFNDVGPIGRIRAATEARRHLTLLAIWRANVGGFDIPESVLARMRHLYARSIAVMDDWLARVLEQLDRRKLLDDTLVVVTSDHGENLGEGGHIGHAFSLDDRLIRVPLVFAGPGMTATAAPVSLADVPRLIAGAADVREHPYHADDVPAGAAVAEYDGVAPPGDPRAEQIVRDWGLGPAAVERLTEPMVCATDGRTKLVRYRGEELVYDLASDPLETRPRPPGGDDALDVLRAAIAHADRRAVHPDGPAPRAAAPMPTSEDEDLEARLRLLGYL